VNHLLGKFLPAILAAPVFLASGNSLAATGANTAGAIPIRHVIIIMQENRSFDSYFGTFPGADGIPANTCIPIDPSNPGNGCITPYHDLHDLNAGGPHRSNDAQADIDDGVHSDHMDGFINQQITAPRNCRPDAPNCSTSADGVERRDVVGYHTATEIPNYWTYAQKFVLQDHLFAGIRSWSWPAHLELTSEWSAICSNGDKASSCVTDSEAGQPYAGLKLPWANLFQLFDLYGVSWKYYVANGVEPDCEDDALTCTGKPQTAKKPSYWNPAPYFTSVQKKGAAYTDRHNPDAKQFFTDLKNGTLPQVSWIVPTQDESEHPPAGVTRGMEHVTRMVNAVMGSQYWKDTAIFISWDDWGGFYDHMPPPNVDRNSNKGPAQEYGVRVPGLMISAYAKAGTIDHSVLSFDSYATFIEELFMNGAHLDPRALGNPDSRPSIRDALTQVRYPDGSTAPIGKLMDEFDFTQKPLPPLKLSIAIPTDLSAMCASTKIQHCTQFIVALSWRSVGSNGFVYHIERDGVDLPQCKGTVTHCTDTPGSGAHLYRAYSVSPNNVTSPRSAAVEADAP